MKHHKSSMRRLGYAGGLGGVLAALALALAGCTDPQIRSQCAEETDHEVKYDVRTIGDVSSWSNAEPIPVGGVGLVDHLEGTGGNPLHGGYTTMLENELHKRNPRDLKALLERENARDVKSLLASPNVSVVVVNGVIPAGAHKDDPIDIEVTLPPGSRTSSLRGGVLQHCILYNYEYARNLSADYASSNRALMGEPLANAEGPLLVGFGDGDEAAKLRQGRIWGGGRSRAERPFFLLLNSDHQFARVASTVADRINELFHAPAGTPGDTLAVAKNRSVVLVSVPWQYRHNLPRFLRVVRLIPLHDSLESLHDDHVATSTGKTSPSSNQAAYRRRLAEDLLDPARTVTAALRLEALGASSIPALKAGLERKHTLVRFCSAEALAYLDCPTAGAELARLVEEHPMLRAFSLTALASMDEAVCHVKLRELLSSAKPETRYGAFRALRALDERDPTVEGDLLNESFWLHRVAPSSPPLVHLSTNRRAEIVLFGEDAMLLPPFQFLAGDAVKFTVTAGNNDEHCTLTAFGVHRGTRQTRQCSLKLEEVLRTLADLGGGYPEAVDLLRQAQNCQCLNCPVGVDQLPQAASVYELARASSTAPELLRADAEILDARPDFGATPTLYEMNRGQKARPMDEAGEGTDTHERLSRAGRHGTEHQAAPVED